MTQNFKDIHIGSLVHQKVTESGIALSRICNFMKYDEKGIQQMYQQKDLPSNILLKWSKLLEYDFFRVYSQHLILYAPQASVNYNIISEKKTSLLPQFRKNIYTKEVIDFILQLIETEEKTKFQIIEEYKIPKTTLYKWISKYSKKL